jgi:ketosteroid isomerase-like protein
MGRTDDDRTEILRLDAEWSKIAASGDLERIVSFWADDASVLPPGSPPLVGKRAIRDYVEASLRTPGFSISWNTRDVVVSAGGDLAYGVGVNRVSFSGPDGKPVVIEGNAVTVWRKDPAGWKCVIDIWNSP